MQKFNEAVVLTVVFCFGTDAGACSGRLLGLKAVSPPITEAGRTKAQQLSEHASPEMRLRGALFLAETADTKAIPALIKLVGELRADRAADVQSLLMDAAGELAPSVFLGDQGTVVPMAANVWNQWWRDLGGKRLLSELMKGAYCKPDYAQDLVRKLGDKSFSVRRRAEKELILLGPSVLPFLKHPSINRDAEVRRLAQSCITALTPKRRLTPWSSIARLIGWRRPPGAAEAILTCLPSMDEDVAEEFRYALDAVAYVNGQPDQQVLQALTDKWAARRAAAAEALCAGPWQSHAKEIRRLLSDPEGSVRLRTALALASAGDATAIPTLIALAESSLEQGIQAEDYLKLLASDKGPKFSSKPNMSRKDRGAAWSEWWDVNKGRTVLVDHLGELRREYFQLRSDYRGYTLLVQTKNGNVTELDERGGPRWSVTGLAMPCDAQVVKGGRVLIVEMAKRVTERTLDGKILWTKEAPGAICVQRLANGNTLIVCGGRLLEVNGVGEEVLDIPHGDNAGKINLAPGALAPGGGGLFALVFHGGIAAARKLPNGRFVLYEYGQLVQLDAKGRELKKHDLKVGDRWNDILDGWWSEILDDGHVLIASPDSGNLIEFDAEGKEIHRFETAGARHGFRLPNGHTLVVIHGRKYVELDENWCPIREIVMETPAFRVKRR